MHEQSWYKDGLRFNCTGCGNCCTGAPGVVWVTEEEQRAIADSIGEADADQFARRYLRKVNGRTSLVEFANGDCVFFDPKQRNCRIYDVRPRQCRTWPFWDSNIRTPEDWERTCKECPGAGQGKLYDIGELNQLSHMP
jgi:Fe-S-cluster containining protein